MAQAFITTYNNFFRWHPIDRRKSLKPVDKVAEELPEGDIWILPKRIGEDDEEGGGQSMAAAEAAIRRMYRKRLWSIYQVDYCADMMPKEKNEEEEGKTESFDNALLFYCKSLYEPKKQKIPPPLPSARRIYGYIRPTNMYIPLTTYQVLHGKVAYQILDSNSRPKPQSTDVQIEDTTKKPKEEEDRTITQDELKKSAPMPKQKQKNVRDQVSNKVSQKISRVSPTMRTCKCSLKSR